MKSFYPVCDFFVEKILDKWGENCSGRYRAGSLSVTFSSHFIKFHFREKASMPLTRAAQTSILFEREYQKNSRFNISPMNPRLRLDLRIEDFW